MGRSNRDVGGYRGRKTITDILTYIAIILAVLVVLLVAGLFFGQKYIVYTDDGIKLELPPFLQMFRQEKQPGTSSSFPDLGNISVVEDPIGSQSEPQKKEAGYALELPLDEVIQGTAAAKLEEAGATALILQAKAQSGQLIWNSQEVLAGQSHVNGPQTVNDALTQWNAGEVYTIARVCCFRDDSAPYYRNRVALRRGNNNWRDELGLRWMSPAHEESQAYIAALCGELATMGFDEIVLEDFAFPIQGNLENINVGDSYNPAQFTAEVETFLTQVQQAVEPYGTKISLRVGRDTLAGTETVSGVTAQVLEQYALRVWTEEDGLQPAPLELLTQAGITGGEGRLLLIVPARTEGGDRKSVV